MAEGETTVVPLTSEQLAQINRLATVARFVSALAHELNNSLQVMGGLLELLAERDDLPHDALLRIERIGAHADQAGVKIKQVVSYVRAPAHTDTRVDLAALVERALTLRSYELERAGIRTVREVTADRFAVHGSARDLEQVVLNLLANAQEALAASDTRELRIGMSRTAGRIRLSLTDTGPGVPVELRGRIFEPFFTTHASTGAVGLGLTVAAHMAEAHGGRLSLLDERSGATFVLDLPDAAAQAR
jgi:C4-dicarboxylate-specific signal transduction histidine kinase